MKHLFNFGIAAVLFAALAVNAQVRTDVKNTDGVYFSKVGHIQDWATITNVTIPVTNDLIAATNYMAGQIANATNQVELSSNYFDAVRTDLTNRITIASNYSAAMDSLIITNNIAVLSNYMEAAKVGTNDAAYLAALTNGAMSESTSNAVWTTGRILGISVRTNYEASGAASAVQGNLDTASNYFELVKVSSNNATYTATVAKAASALQVESDPVHTNWLATNTYVKTETDPVFTNWLATNTYVKVEADSIATNLIEITSNAYVAADAVITGSLATVSNMVTAANNATNAINTRMGAAEEATNAINTSVAILNTNAVLKTLSVTWVTNNLDGTNSVSFLNPWNGTNYHILTP